MNLSLAPRTGAVRHGICTVVAALALAGCGSSASTSPSSVTPPAPVQITESPAAAPAPATRATPRSAAEPAAALALPTGQVPRAAVGRWSGGENDTTGEYLLVTADGRYARGRNGQDPYRMGVIVAQGNRFVTYDVDGQQEAGSWEYTNAAGIEVLGIWFGSSYYSYARA
jgi:hypothetical protein